MIIESDCKKVVELVNNTTGSKTAIHWIILEIQFLCRNLQSVKVNFVPRGCNVHAHSLAKFALEKDIAAVWENSFPADIQLVLDSVILV